MLRIASRAAVPLVLIAACSDPVPAPEEDAPAEEVTTAVAPDKRPVALTQTLGTFEGSVTDLAAIEDATFGFQGHILAANGSAGIQAIRVDGGGAQTLGVDGDNPPRTMAVSYAYGPEPHIILAVPQAEETRLVARTLTGERTTLSTAIPGEVVDLCVAEGRGVAVTASGSVWSFPARTSEGFLDEPAGEMSGIGEVRRCFGTASTLFVTTGEAIFAMGPTGLEAADLDPSADEIVETGEGFIPVKLSRGMLMIDGEEVEVVDDDGAPIEAAQLDITGGNFGGVLRDGLVALLDKDNTLHTVPWSALANAAGAPRQTLSARPATPAYEVIDGPALPELRGDESTIELSGPPRQQEEELPQPPALPDDQ